METRFGHDFGRVRVHSDSAASRSADALNAAAYTIGSSIFFARGRWAPETADGRRLLAHELAHVVQTEHAASAIGHPGVAAADGGPEVEARGAADAVARNATPQVSAAPVQVYRAPATPTSGADSPKRKRVVYLDASVIVEIERGNVAAAEALKNLVATADVRIAEFTRSQLVDKAAAGGKKSGHPEVATAHRMIIEDLRIMVVPDLPERVAHATAQNRVTGKTGTFNVIDAGDVALVAGLPPEAELFSLDRRLVNNAAAAENAFGIKFADESHRIKNVAAPGGKQPAPDYSTGRALLGLDPVVIDPSGKVERRGRQGSVTKDTSTREARQKTTVEHPSGKLVSGEIDTARPSRGGGGGGGAGATGRALPTAQTPGVKSPSAELSPRAVSARTLAGELAQTEFQINRIKTATRIANYTLSAMDFLSLLEDVAKARNMSAAILAGGSPYYREVQAASAVAAQAKELANHHRTVDVWKDRPWGHPEWDSWSELQQIQMSYFFMERHLSESRTAVRASQRDLARQLSELTDALKDKIIGATFQPYLSMPLADAYFFAQEGGKVRSSLIEAAASYADAQSSITQDLMRTRGIIKTIELRLRDLGVTGYVVGSMSDKQARAASLNQFTMRAWNPFTDAFD